MSCAAATSFTPRRPMSSCRSLLGLPPPIYHHHRLITDGAGRKLSKSDRATSLRSLARAARRRPTSAAMIGIDAALA